MTISGLVLPLECLRCGGVLVFVENVEDKATKGIVARAGVKCEGCDTPYCVTATLRQLPPSSKGWRPTYIYDDA